MLVDRAARANQAGVAEVWIDPGIGFGKTVDHNLALLGSLDDLVATGYPVMVGTSRKSFLASVGVARRWLVRPGRRAAPRFAGHGHLGHVPGRPDGAGPRCRGHRPGRGAGGAGGLRRRRPAPGRAHGGGGSHPETSARSIRRSERERQVGGGDPSPQLHLGDQGPPGHERAAGRLRPQPPEGAAPGGDHLAAGPGVHPGGLAAAVLPQSAGLRGAVDGQRALPPPVLGRHPRGARATSTASCTGA